VASRQTENQNLVPEVVVAGHICLDVTPEFPQTNGQAPIEPGQLREVGPAAYATGGSVANTGLALHHLGIVTSLMGKIGNDPFGEQLLNLLNDINPKLGDGMIVAPAQNTSYSVVISPPGVDRSFLHSPAANDTFNADDINLTQVNGAKIFHFGYPPLMQRFWDDGGANMAQLFRRVKELGTMTSLDMAMPDPAVAAGQIDWVAWLREVLPQVDLFLPSLEEIIFMLGAMPDSSGGPEFSLDILSSIADQLITLGTPIVVLKLGSSGLYMKTTADANRVSQAFFQGKTGIKQWVSRELYSPCFDVQVTSTNGAGDRTIAGFLAALVRDANPSQALETAVAVGAASVECCDPGRNMPLLEKLEERIRAGWNRKAVDGLIERQWTLSECGCWQRKQGNRSI
jgi:sugar/nucleoside kinase (ribokinase family)